MKRSFGALLVWLEACIDVVSLDIRGIAQPGSAAVLGTAGRWFESSCPDHWNQILSEIDFPEKIGRGKAGGRKSSSRAPVWLGPSCRVNGSGKRTCNMTVFAAHSPS